MSDDLLGSIIDHSTDASRPGAAEKPARSADALVAGVVASLKRTPAASAPAPVDCDILLQLDATGWKTVLRYLPAELLVPLLGGASLAVADRLVRALDAEAQAWLVHQSAAIERVTAGEHAAAAQRMKAILDRLVGQGRIVLSASAAAPAASAPAATRTAVDTTVQVGFAAAPVAVQAVPPTAPAAEAQSARRLDTLIDGLAALVRAAQEKPAAELVALAAELDHPALVQGLRLVAAGTDAHELVEALRRQEERLIAEQHATCAAIREALLTIRFGEGPAAFRARVERR